MLKTIKWEGAQIEDRSYNDNGLLTGVTRAFVNETRTYNAGSQLTQINNTNVGSQTYTYDQNGNVTSETLSGNMANYSFSTIHAGGPFADGYDAEDRFMRFKRSGVTEDILLTRSNIGNIANVNRNGSNTARGYNTTHGLTTVTGGTTQTYDTDGNTTKLHTNVYAAWDDAGRMKNTSVPTGATAGIQGFNEYGYVGGTRVWKKITRSGKVVEHRVHIHAGPNLIAEYNAGVVASTPVQEYVYAGEIDSLVMIRRSDATKYGVTRNRQWSITALHDLANGNVVERYAYEMTGKRTIYAANGTTVRSTSSFGNHFGYTNRWHDAESDLMYFRARFYNPLTGEFLSRDPAGFVDGISLYRGYMDVNYVDPSGLQTVRCRCYSGWLDGDVFGSTTDVQVECNRVLDDCCRKACSKLGGWTGTYTAQNTETVSYKKWEDYLLTTESLHPYDPVDLWLTRGKLAAGTVAVGAVGWAAGIIWGPGAISGAAHYGRSSFAVAKGVYGNFVRVLSTAPTRAPNSLSTQIARFFTSGVGYKTVVRSGFFQKLIVRPWNSWLRSTDKWLYYKLRLEWHHWWYAQSIRPVHAGWNLFPLPAFWNGLIGNGTRGRLQWWLFRGTQAAIPSSGAAAAYGAYKAGKAIGERGCDSHELPKQPGDPYE